MSSSLESSIAFLPSFDDTFSAPSTQIERFQPGMVYQRRPPVLPPSAPVLPSAPLRRSSRVSGPPDRYGFPSLITVVDMSRIRIEDLLAAFPKLVGTGKQQTYVETENVRYVYQPIEALYLLLVTNKQSNILEDRKLEVLSKLVPEYSYFLDEEGICRTGFELIFAFDEVISLGTEKGKKWYCRFKRSCEMESHEEKLHKLVLQSKINETMDVMKCKATEIDKSKIEKNRGEKGGFISFQLMGSGRIESGFSDMGISSGGGGFGSGSGFGLSIDVESVSTKSKGCPPSSVTAPPKGLGMQLGKSQRTNQFLESLKAEGEVILEDVHQKRAGQIIAPPLAILSDEDGLTQVQIETGGNPVILFKTHPNMNKELFTNENILGLKDRMGLSSLAKLVMREYLFQLFERHQVLGRLMERGGMTLEIVLEWSIFLIDNSIRSGLMEFVVPPADSSTFFPISCSFHYQDIQMT
ncbi:hypothetical protein Patl1_12286 [Pistacia atlantica]|uniref:Uncharacterized protein n=1 Tax=Pistacia atlantica TaxID=434234 RepID=A0ACC1A3Z8_9ROSI|nr:hypothetical protein Patl1_12286 [Pistacia atlantica]